MMDKHEHIGMEIKKKQRAREWFNNDHILIYVYIYMYISVLFLKFFDGLMGRNRDIVGILLGMLSTPSTHFWHQKR